MSLQQGPRVLWPPLASLLVVAAGGGFGGALRYALTLAFPADAAGFPWLTFGINTGGAALLGFLLTRLPASGPRAAMLRLFLATGVLGSFTTFSSFSLEVVELAGQGDAALALAYSVASIGVGLAACAAGVAAGRRSRPQAPR